MKSHEIRRKLNEEGISISRTTIHNYRKQLGSKKFRSRLPTILNDSHIIKRLQILQYLSNNHFEETLFIDE